MFELLDAICAANLKTDVETFVRKIEATTEWRREVIINYALDEDNTIIAKITTTALRKGTIHCPVCKKELHYCIPKEQFLEDPRNKGLKLAVGQFGQYSCKNPQCKHSANGKLAPYMERDIDVFIRYGE